MGSRLTRFVHFALCCLLLVFVLKCMYSERYEGARSVADNVQRIPLWFPYEITSEAPFREAQILTWSHVGFRDFPQVWESRIPSNDKVLGLEKITRFSLGRGVLCGTTSPLNVMQRTQVESHYVIWATNMVSVQVYEQEMPFLEACRRYGVDGGKLDDFNVNFANYWDGPGRTTLWRILASFSREPISLGEGLILLVVLLATICSLRRLMRPGKSTKRSTNGVDLRR